MNILLPSPSARVERAFRSSSLARLTHGCCYFEPCAEVFSTYIPT